MLLLPFFKLWPLKEQQYCDSDISLQQICWSVLCSVTLVSAPLSVLYPKSQLRRFSCVWSFFEGQVSLSMRGWPFWRVVKVYIGVVYVDSCTGHAWWVSDVVQSCAAFNDVNLTSNYLWQSVTNRCVLPFLPVVSHANVRRTHMQLSLKYYALSTKLLDSKCKPAFILFLISWHFMGRQESNS